MFTQKIKKVNDNTVHRVHQRASYLTSGGAPENKSPGIPPIQNRISDQAIHLAQASFQSTIQFHHQSFDGLYQQFILEYTSYMHISYTSKLIKKKTSYDLRNGWKTSLSCLLQLRSAATLPTLHWVNNSPIEAKTSGIFYTPVILLPGSLNTILESPSIIILM